MDFKRIWTKTWRTMLQALIPFIPINVAMLNDLDIKVVAVEVIGAGIVCFIMGMLDNDNNLIDEEGALEDEEEE